jgi:hypothetical protein
MYGSILRRLVNDELKSSCIEAVVAYLKVVYLQMPRGTKDPQKPELR